MLGHGNADTYLQLVEGWTDPYPQPIIETISENISVLRDDLIQYGSKIRFLDYFVKNCQFDELVYGSSPAYGYAQISLGYLCKKYNKKCIMFQAGRKHLHPYQQKAIELGVEFHFAKMGMLTVTESRARKYSEDNKNSILLPIGLEHDTAFGSIIKVCRSLPHEKLKNINHIWVASSSGTLARGIKLAFPDKEIHCVSVGHKMSNRELGDNILHPSKYKFNQEVKTKDLPPYPSALNYDAKIWDVLQNYIKYYPSEKHLVWNVGS